MATVFLDRKGVFMVEFMQQGTIVTLEVYYETLKNQGPFRTKGMECISTGSCLTTLLTALISLQVTAACLLTPT
jgi:hypothetical protein